MMKVLCIWIFGMSLVSFIVYGIDKKKAEHHAWRVRESVLILLAFAGGAPGALAGMRVFHHKTRKRKFRILVPLALILWIMIAGMMHEKVK